MTPSPATQGSRQKALGEDLRQPHPSVGPFGEGLAAGRSSPVPPAGGSRPWPVPGIPAGPWGCWSHWPGWSTPPAAGGQRVGFPGFLIRPCKPTPCLPTLLRAALQRPPPPPPPQTKKLTGLKTRSKCKGPSPLFRGIADSPRNRTPPPWPLWVAEWVCVEWGAGIWGRETPPLCPSLTFRTLIWVGSVDLM